MIYSFEKVLIVVSIFSLCCLVFSLLSHESNSPGGLNELAYAVHPKQWKISTKDRWTPPKNWDSSKPVWRGFPRYKPGLLDRIDF